MQDAVHDSNTQARTAPRVLAVVRSVVAWALLAAALWFVWPSSLGGCTTLTVVSGHSMEPTYYTGDLVVARCGTPAVGDVVVYRPAEIGGSARIIHRIIGGDGATGWRLKGDNNSFVDPFSPRSSDVVGVAVLHLPKVGRISVLLLNPWLWAAVILAAMVLLIWPSSASDDEDEEGEPVSADVDQPAAGFEAGTAVQTPEPAPSVGVAAAADQTFVAADR